MKYRVRISNDGSGMNKALELADSTAKILGLGKKEASRLRLLAEEMLSMVRAVTGDFSAEFWFENEGKNCSLHLTAKTQTDYKKRNDILSVSTTGRNTAQRGIMERIREILEAGLHGMEESLSLQAQYGTGMYAYGTLGIGDSAMADAIYSWSMQKYRADVENTRTENPDAWDELEKSIIANIADEVQAGVSRDRIELVIYKNFEHKQEA